MSRALHGLVVVGLAALSYLTYGASVSQAGDPPGTVKAPPAPAPVTNSTTGASSTAAAGWYYYQASNGCYYYYYVPAPAAAAATNAAAKTSVAAANLNSGTYRSFSADTGTPPTYYYYPTSNYSSPRIRPS